MNPENDLQSSYQKAERALLREDYDAAFDLYRELASNGNKDCYGVLGWLYFSGKGVHQDFGQAREWLTRAAENDDPQGQFYLAKLCWHEGDGACVLRWLDAAIKHQYGPAFFRLGRAYEDGVFVKRDLKAASHYYNIAAEKGHLVGGNRLALLRMRGSLGIKEMPAGSLRYVKSIFSILQQALKDPNADSLRV